MILEYGLGTGRIAIAKLDDALVEAVIEKEINEIKEFTPYILTMFYSFDFESHVRYSFGFQNMSDNSRLVTKTLQLTLEQLLREQELNQVVVNVVKPNFTDDNVLTFIKDRCTKEGISFDYKGCV